MFRGYLHYEGSRSDGNRTATYILPGHVATVFLLVLTIAAYVSLGLSKAVTFWGQPYGPA